LGYLFETCLTHNSDGLCVATFSSWRCLAGDMNGRNMHPVHSTLDAPQWVSDTINRCTDQTTGQKIVYSFIISPQSNGSNSGNTLSWIKANLFWVFIVAVSVLIVLFFVVYWIQRLTRYRKKYHEQRKAVEKQQEEVNEMEQFGGSAGVKDDEVMMMSNPLVLQMKDMQQKLDSKTQQMKLEEQKTREQHSDANQQYLSALDQERQQLASELARLQQQLSSQQQQQRPMRPADTQQMPPPASYGGPSTSGGMGGPQAIRADIQPSAPTQRQDFQAAPKKHKDL